MRLPSVTRARRALLSRFAVLNVEGDACEVYHYLLCEDGNKPFKLTKHVLHRRG